MVEDGVKKRMVPGFQDVKLTKKKGVQFIL
jgi:hypothetical protein